MIARLIHACIANRVLVLVAAALLAVVMLLLHWYTRAAGFSREESSSDVAAELTQLIQTQRAYSSNAKVIQTVDEMLQETTNIKR